MEIEIFFGPSQVHFPFPFTFSEGEGEGEASVKMRDFRNFSSFFQSFSGSFRTVFQQFLEVIFGIKSRIFDDFWPIFGS